jgi:hypothetical protein
LSRFVPDFWQFTTPKSLDKGGRLGTLFLTEHFARNLMPIEITMRAALAALRRHPSVSVPEAGRALANLGKNASYEAAKKGTLGVPVFESAGRKRVPSIAVLRQLGLADEGPQAA